MSSTQTPRSEGAASGRRRIKATRPALIDLRFTGDAWLVQRGSYAAVCLGDTVLGQISLLSLDLPSLNRLLGQVRMGQARKNYMRRLRTC
jgi:hypothetical protein